MNLATWRRYAMDRISEKAGLLSLQCRRAYLHGLLGYEIVALGEENHMTVDLFRTVECLRDSTSGSLMAAVEAIATEQGCVAIDLDLSDFQDASIVALKPRSLAFLCRTGQAIDSIQLSKRLNYPRPLAKRSTH